MSGIEILSALTLIVLFLLWIAFLVMTLSQEKYLKRMIETNHEHILELARMVAKLKGRIKDLEEETREHDRTGRRS